MSVQKKNVLIWGVIVAILCGIVFITSSMLANAQETEGDASADEASAEVQTTDDAELSATRIRMYRLYNKYTGEHFYTKDTTEKTNLIRIGWTDEGIGWIAPSTSKYPVYRLNNPFSANGDHHYTMDQTERDSLVKAGWKYEGIGWYSLAKDDQGAIPLLRQYNKYATSGSHNYTTSEAEQKTLVAAGWKAEGIGWYGYDKDSSLSDGGKIDFTKATVDTASKVYKAAQWQPSVSIPGLTKNKDYTVTYGANKNAGTGTITVKGKGNWTGSKTYTFKITQREITKVTWGISTATYSGAVQTPTCTATGVLAADLKNFKVNVTGGQKNAGTFTVTASSVNNSNYKLKQKFTQKCTITPAEVTVSGISAQSKTYDGSTDAVLDYTNLNIRGIVSDGDKLTVTATGKFVSEAVSDDPITVNITGLKLGGASVANYKLAAKGQQTTTQAYIRSSDPDMEYTYDVQNHGNTIATKAPIDGGRAEEPSTAEIGDVYGLKLEGWYKEPECKNKWNFASDSATVSTTLYANWVPDADANKYWIGPSKEVITDNNSAVSNDDYVTAEWNVLKSTYEINADVGTIKNEIAEGTADREGSVTNEYKKLMADDKYHLYTKWKGNTTDASDEAQDENKYAEFRIIEVGSHEDDGSGLTFQSVYLFSDAYYMSEDGINTGGWAKSDMRTYLNGTSFAGKFNTAFTDAIVAVPKVTTEGDGSSETTEAVTDKLWLTSQDELTGYNDSDYAKEGSQYAFYASKQIQLGAQNPVLSRTTRAGNKIMGGSAAGAEFETDSWWTRTPAVSQSALYYRLAPTGDQLLKEVKANNKFGVLPSFCF